MVAKEGRERQREITELGSQNNIKQLKLSIYASRHKDDHAKGWPLFCQVSTHRRKEHLRRKDA